MKFLSGCFGKVLRFLLAVLLGVVLTLGGIVGAGYFALMTKGIMGTVSDKVNDSGAGITLQFTDEVRDMSLFEWGKGLVDLASRLTAENGPTIGELETYIGIDKISSSLADVLKMEQEDFKNASLTGSETGLAAVIVNKMTMKNLVKMVGEDNNFLPDLPLFKDDSEFMDKPLKEAFSNLTDYTIGDFIEVKPDSASVIKAVASIKIKEVGDKLPTLPIGDFIDQGEDTHPVIKAIAELSINDLGTSKLTEAVNKMKLSDVLTGMEENSTNQVLFSLKDVTIGELSGSEADKLIKSMFLCEIMDIDGSSNRTLQTLQHACISSQYVTLESPTIIDGNAYVAGENYSLISQNTNGSCYVLYYPEETVYSCVKEGDSIPVRSGGYPVSYRIYRPTSSLDGEGKVTVNGVLFSAVSEEEGNNITSGENTLVGATLYVKQKDAVLSQEDGTATVKNRYHCLFDEDGHYLFVNGFDDATPKGAMYLPAACVDAIDVDTRLVSSLAEYKISDTQFLDRKAVKTNETYTSGGADLRVYRYYPLEGINEKMNDLTLEGVIDITESSPRLLKSIRDTKITQMGSKIDTMTLGEMVDVGSSKLLQSLSDATLNSLGDKVNTLFIDEIIALDANSSQMIRSLRYATLNSQIEYLNPADLVASGLLTTADAATYHAQEAPEYALYEKAADKTIANRYYYRVSGGLVDNVYVLYYDENDEVRTQGGNTAYYKIRCYEQKAYSFIDLSTLTLPENVNGAIGDNQAVLDAQEADKTYYYQVDGAGAIVTTYILALKDGQPETDPGDATKTRVYTVTEKYNRPMMGLSDKTNELTLGDVFSGETLEKGVLGLIDSKTKLNDISNKVAQAVQNSSVAILADTGVVAKSTFTGSDFASLAKERKSFLYNSTITDMLDGMFGFIANPVDMSNPLMPSINYARVSPRHFDIAETSFSSLTQFVGAYSQYGEVQFSGGNVTVTVDTATGSYDNLNWGRDINGDNVIDYYAIPMFSLVGSNAVVFSDSDSNPVDVYIAVYNRKIEKTTVTQTAFASLSDFVAAYEQNDSLTLSGNVTVTVDVAPGSADEAFGVDSDSDTVIDYYEIPAYVLSGTTYTITFEDADHNPITVQTAIFDDLATGYLGYHKHQVGYYYDSTSAILVPEAGNTKIERIS